MAETIHKDDKKRYLKWLSENFRFKKRESLWILNFLYNHDVMLNRTHFVEYAHKTPRGLYLTTTEVNLPAFRFYKNGKEFNDAMQAFHEVRLNWSSPLFIEVNLPHAWQHPLYLSVLEDNPYARWNETIPMPFKQELGQALDGQLLEHKRLILLDQIDEALMQNSPDDFNELTAELRAVEREIAEFRGE